MGASPGLTKLCADNNFCFSNLPFTTERYISAVRKGRLGKRFDEKKHNIRILMNLNYALHLSKLFIEEKSKLS